ncbi:hypothetical protein JVT61DRAFT_14677 [Boletus reticuloceps]|uniref:Uncharacterized protein n=1 Tax=Boletus reticuloceps TaxID=495285 RepID=A0A8I2YSU4_9AGAM|nr:hypothetical protein JVT61DRAFT_14677 [Boletus reticuloceps]
MVAVTSTPASANELEELLALIERVSLSPADAERVVAVTRQRAGALATGPDSPSINADIEAPCAADTPPDPDGHMSALVGAIATDTPSGLAGAAVADTPSDPNAPVALSEHYTMTHNGIVFYFPMPGVSGPYYLVTKGRAIGIIAQWHRASPLVSDISCAVFCKVKCLTQARKMMETAIDDGNIKDISANPR